MSDESVPVNHAEANPVCPYCNRDPLGITCRDIMFPNGLIALLAFCAQQRIAAPGLIDRTLIDKIKKSS